MCNREKETRHNDSNCKQYTTNNIEAKDGQATIDSRRSKLSNPGRGHHSPPGPTILSPPGKYSNARLDYLLDRGANEPDSKERQNTYKDIQQILSQDMPVVNLFELEYSQCLSMDE